MMTRERGVAAETEGVIEAIGTGTGVAGLETDLTETKIVKGTEKDAEIEMETIDTVVRGCVTAVRLVTGIENVTGTEIVKKKIETEGEKGGMTSTSPSSKGTRKSALRGKGQMRAWMKFFLLCQSYRHHHRHRHHCRLRRHHPRIAPVARLPTEVIVRANVTASMAIGLRDLVIHAMNSMTHLGIGERETTVTETTIIPLLMMMSLLWIADVIDTAHLPLL
jgi:hypothetical protein